jgi:O-antigen/teichoic acid export membrane protein
MLKSTASPPSSTRSPLKERVLKAGVWSLTGYALGQAIRFGSSLFMTRMLVPEMFGIMAIASIAMVALAMLSDIGLQQVVIRSKRGAEPTFLNTIWVAHILRGVLLWTAGLCIAAFLFLANRIGLLGSNSVYADPALPYVIALLSLGALIGGFTSTKVFEASRHLSVQRLVPIEIVSQIGGLVCMIAWILIDRSIFALVSGSIAGSLIKMILSHVSLPGVTNRWSWEKAAFAEIFQFGKWIFVTSILGFLVDNGDRLLLGAFVTPGILGVYTIAQTLFSSVQQVMTLIIGDISYPALSEIVRERPADLRAHFYKFHVIIGSFAFLCSGFLMGSGHTLVHFLYDARYEEAGWMLQALSSILMTIPFRISSQCFMALGMPHILSRIIAARLLVLFSAVPIGFWSCGLLGAVCGIVASHFASLPVIIFYNRKNNLFNLQIELLLPLLIPFGFAVAVLLEMAMDLSR